MSEEEINMKSWQEVGSSTAFNEENNEWEFILGQSIVSASSDPKGH